MPSRKPLRQSFTADWARRASEQVRTERGATPAYDLINDAVKFNNKSGIPLTARMRAENVRLIRGAQNGAPSQLTAYQRRRAKADASSAFGGKALTVG